MITDTPPTIAMGRSLPGFFISPAMAPTLVQPSKANRMATISCPRTTAGLSPSPTIGVKIGFAPPPFTNPNIISRIKGINLQTVKMICTLPPTFEPRLFKKMIRIIMPIARGTVKPSPINSAACWAHTTARADVMAG